MANFNKVILVGRLTADPELKQTTTGLSVCSFSIAVNRRFSKAAEGQPTADFFNIVAWRNTAEFVCRSFRKGRPILVCGQLQNRTWTDSQGVKRYATEIVADEVDFVDSRPEGAAQGAGQGDGQYTPDAYGAPAYSNRGDSQANVDFVDVADDSGLPF
ncbi:MAG: single-stranded DNA-binding protein [Clostridia bacterium]|nr:single-stranded DNA-binding protein [Clostridia bacterium]